MRLSLVFLSVLGACMGGCSGLVRGFIDTQPRVAFNPQSLDDPARVVNGTPVVYTPSGAVTPDLAQDPDVLRFAPLIVQGFQPQGQHAHYPIDDDAIGAPRLNADASKVTIDTSLPVVYTRVEHADIAGHSLKQLVYSFWYPRRPVGSVETGSVDGGILRVTLDDSGQPGVFEYSQPCGCFHGVFVADRVNDAARIEFGDPAPHRLYAVEAPLSGHDDWVVRSLVHIRPGERVAMYVSAGKHFCEAIASRADDALVASGRRYAIEPYDALTRVPMGDSTGSIFGRDGLVIGAERKSEQVLMSDLDHAGWPRHLDKMLIHWDAEHWTDPTLLATRLRLPSVMSNRNASVMPAGSGAAQGHPTLAASGRRLVLFTNVHCSGCQLTKQTIQQSPALQRALRSWDYRVVDTATPEGERLAAENRVTLVPVLIGFDGERELFRDENIDSSGKIAAVLREYP